MKNLIKSLLLCSILSVTCNVFAAEEVSVKPRFERPEDQDNREDIQKQRDALNIHTNFLEKNVPEESEKQETKNTKFTENNTNRAASIKIRKDLIENSRFDLTANKGNGATVEKSSFLDFVKKRLNVGDVSRAKDAFSSAISDILSNPDETSTDTNPFKDPTFLKNMKRCDTEEKNTAINDGLQTLKATAKEYTRGSSARMDKMAQDTFTKQINDIKANLKKSGMLNPDQTLEILDSKGNAIELNPETIARLQKDGTLFDISFRIETDAQKDTRNQEQAAKKSEQDAKELDNFNRVSAALKETLLKNLSKQGFKGTEISNISNIMLDQNITYNGLMDFNDLLTNDRTNLNKISQALQKTPFSKIDSENLPTKLQNLQDVAKVVLSLPKEWSKDDRANIAIAMLNAKFRPEDQKNFDAFIEKNKDAVRTAIQTTIADKNQQINLFTNLLKGKTTTSISRDDFVAFLSPTAKQVQPNTQAEQPTAPVATPSGNQLLGQYNRTVQAEQNQASPQAAAKGQNISKGDNNFNTGAADQQQQLNTGAPTQEPIQSNTQAAKGTQFGFVDTSVTPTQNTTNQSNQQMPAETEDDLKQQIRNLTEANTNINIISNPVDYLNNNNKIDALKNRLKDEFRAYYPS